MMQTYAEFSPTGFDAKGAFLDDDRQDWLVLPVSQTRDSGPMAESNFQTALSIMGGESDTVEVHRFGHWGPGWFEIIIVDPKRRKEADEIESSLENYPVLDDMDLSERESEQATEDWDNYGRRDFEGAIQSNFEFSEEDEELLDYINYGDLWSKAADEIGWAEESSDEGTHFNIGEAVEFFLKKPELVFGAINDAKQSPEYLGMLKKAEDAKLAHWLESTRASNPPGRLPPFSELNLDAMDADELWAFHTALRGVRPISQAKQLFPRKPKKYVATTNDLKHYAANKATAMAVRLRGDIQTALMYEKIADRIYGQLPSYARW